MTLRLGARAHLVHYPLRGGVDRQSRRGRSKSGWRGEDGRRSLGRRRRPPRARARLRRLVARGARADRRAPTIGAPGRFIIAPPIASFRRGPRRAARRRRASDGSVSRAGRGAGDRGRRRAGAPPRRDATTSPPRSPPIRAIASRARRACSARRWRKARIYHMSGPIGARARPRRCARSGRSACSSATTGSTRRKGRVERGESHCIADGAAGRRRPRGRRWRSSRRACRFQASARRECEKHWGGL